MEFERQAGLAEAGVNRTGCSSTTALYVTKLMSNCRIVQCVDAAKQPAC
jgi:hypothetical protein